MQKTYVKWIKFLYGPIFKIIVFFYDTYKANRARVENIKSNQLFATLLKLITMLVFTGWILIWLFSDKTNQTSLIDEVKQSIDRNSTETQN